MFQEANTFSHSSGQESKQNSSLFMLCVQLFFAMLAFVAIVGGYFVLLTALSPIKSAPIAHAAVIERHVNVSLNIVINQAGMQQDWPAYSPTAMTVPANSLVTVTIHNYDLGDTPLPTNSPFSKVQGTVGGVATANGLAYNYLAPAKVAHTFTISQLNVNVPIPGDAPKGATYASVTFTFHTGKAGTYTFQCFDPCGTGSSGWMGPMMTKGYMVGTLTVQ